MSDNIYTSKNHAKFYMKSHIILVCKYRKRILTGKLRDDIIRSFKQIESKSDFIIDIMETDLDHIHFLISHTPRFSISQIIRRLKQSSTKYAWKYNSKFLSKVYWGRNKKLWTSGYFSCSIGMASPETVKNYILNQG